MAASEQVDPRILIDQLRHGLCDLVALLRRAGMQVSVSALLDAQRVLGLVDPARRSDAFWALHTALVKNEAQRALFAQAFALAWQGPDKGPGDETAQPAGTQKINQRLADALAAPDLPPSTEPSSWLMSAVAQAPTLESSLNSTEQKRSAYSLNEALNTTDFGELSASELAQVCQDIVAMRAFFRPRPIRRFESAAGARILDPGRTQRQALRTGGIPIALYHRRRRRLCPPLIILCDVSGSMQLYSRMLLLLAYSVAHARPGVSLFLFGTRLNNVSRQLAERDPDRALSSMAEAVPDWHGGTRIARCLLDFRRNWSRRVATAGATVWLVTDGLDRDAGSGLRHELEQLRRHCRRLYWLNPLLRFTDYQPLAAGAGLICRAADGVFPVHNLQSLLALGEHLD